MGDDAATIPERFRFHRQVQRPLGGILEQLTSPGQQHPQLRLGVRRPDMLDDPLTPAGVLRDLHRGGTRAGPHPPDERHIRTLNQPP